MSRARPNRTEFVVSWPVQGVAAFRSDESELILSSVYWTWIYEALADTNDGQRLPFVEVMEHGFNDPSELLETFPATPEFLEALRLVDPSRAPRFDLLVPAPGLPVPSPEQILAELERVVREAIASGTLEMKVE